MKILHIISAGYPGGGTENNLIKLKDNFEKKGHEIKILSSNLRPELNHFSDFEFKSINSSNPLKIIFNLFNPYSFTALKKILYGYKPDIVHLHTMEQVSPSVLFLLRKYPTILTLHGPETFIKSLVTWCLVPRFFQKEEIYENNFTLIGRFHYFYHTYIQRYIYKFGFKNVDLFITLSNFTKNKAINDVNPIKTIYTPINLPKYSAIESSNNILFVGRVEKIKGVRYLIEAVPLIIKKIPNIQLYIVGDGHEKNSLFKLVNDIGLSNNIHFIGWQKNEDLKRYYKIASVIIIPSIWPENFPSVCLEAMSFGRPVIGTRVGGIPEIIDDKVNGYLVKPKDSVQIAEKVTKLLLDKNLLKFMSKNARIKSEKYNVENYVTEIEEVYQDIRRKYENK
jgi:glycosyltransferase involved in cell wall biosynthesis